MKLYFYKFCKLHREGSPIRITNTDLKLNAQSVSCGVCGRSAREVTEKMARVTKLHAYIDM